jgi:hypothetical protein
MGISSLQALGEVNFVIPAWQIGLFVALFSLLLLSGRSYLSIVVTYLFILYWGFILHWPDFVAAAEGSSLALTLYIVSGLVIALLAVLAFFYQPS